MKQVWFLKWPLVVFLTGFLIRFVGALYKIRHWPMADELITIGSLIAGAGIIFAIIKIAFMKKPNP